MGDPILIVEDDLALSEALAMQLESAGIQVDRCQTAEVAVELLRLKRYGLVVLDLMLLDGASGVHVLDNLRSTLSRDAPVLVITACNVDNLRSIDRCLVKAIMLKPLDFELFRAYALATYGMTVASREGG
jgi:DNA-binding response OmpR family regulator